MSGTLDLIISTPLIRIGVDDPNTNAWNQIANDVGCGTTADDQQLACMRAVESDTLEQAVISRGSSFYPIVDDITVFSNTRERAAAGNFLQVPMLGGTTAQEGDLLVVTEELATTGIVVPIVTELAADILTAVLFTCPASTAASDRSEAGVPTWRYQYQAIYPNLQGHPSLRSYHASDIPLVFGTYNASNIPAGPTSDEIALSHFMQSAWVAFAKNPAIALDNAPFSWPQANSGGDDIVLLGNSGNASGASFTTDSSVDFNCGIISMLVQVYNTLGIDVSLI